MSSAFIGGTGAILAITSINIAKTLVQQHLSGTSKNYYLDIALSGFLGGCLASALLTPYPIGYAVFFTLLGVTLLTDAWVMLISRYVTLYAIPIALSLSIMKLLPLSFDESLFGAFFGYTLLKTIAYLAQKHFQQEALGQGDIDLLCMIGAFTGWPGCWFTLVIGSILGSLFGFLMLIKDRSWTLNNRQLPLGTFLAMGAMLDVIFAKNIYKLLLIS